MLQVKVGVCVCACVCVGVYMCAIFFFRGQSACTCVRMCVRNAHVTHIHTFVFVALLSSVSRP